MKEKNLTIWDPLNVTIDHEDLKALRHICVDENLKLSQIVRIAIRDWLQAHPPGSGSFVREWLAGQGEKAAGMLEMRSAKAPVSDQAVEDRKAS